MGRKKPQKNKGEGSQQQQQEAQQQQPPVQQQQQPPVQQQHLSAQPTPGPSGDPGTTQSAPSKEGKSKKRSQAQKQPPVQKQTEATQQPPSPVEQKHEQRPTELPVQRAWRQRGPQQQQRQQLQSTPSPQPEQQQTRRGIQQHGRGREQQQPQQSVGYQAGPSSQQPSGGAWQRGAPQTQQPHSPSPSPQQQQGFPQGGRRGSQQSTASSQPQQQPGSRGPYQQAHGRGKGIGQEQPQRPVGYQASPTSQQSGQGAWQRGSPQPQQPPAEKQQYQQHMRAPPHKQEYQQPGRDPPQKREYQQQGRGSPQKPEYQQQQGRGPSQSQGSPQKQEYQQGRGPSQRQQQPQPGGAQEAPTSWQKGQQKQVPPQVQPPYQLQPQHPQQVGQQATAGTSQQQRGQPGPQQKAPEKEQPRAAHDPSPPLDLIVPQRKKLKSGGTAGRKILIETNHLALTLKELKQAIHYDVTITPDTPKRFLRPVMEEFRRQNYPTRYPAFDGRKNLYSSSYLPFGNEIGGEVSVIEDERPKAFQVAVKYAATVDLSILSTYFESAAVGGQHMMTPQEAIQCLDVVLRSAPALRCIPVGRSFFTQPDQIIDLGEGMQMYYGFYQSAILGWKPFLNVDVSHKAFPKSLRIIDLIMELSNGRCDPKDKLNQYIFNTVDKFLRTLKVQYEIPNNPNSRRVMRVNSLDRPASEARFRLDNGNEMTVANYFMNEKAYPLKYPNMPCLWVGSRTRESKMLFPAELCTLLDGQVTNRAMTPNQTTEMIRKAATSTTVRKNKIMESVRQANFREDPSAKEFGISVDTNFARVPARVLDAPSLRYLNRSVRPQRGTWRADSFKTGKSLEKWCILCVDDRTRPQALQEFAEMMIEQGRPLGMVISKPNPVLPVRLVPRREKQELEQQFQKLTTMDLILVVIPTENKDIYNYVKQAAELSVGTLTQCVQGRNVFRPKPATVGNILLKVNAKLNGVNHILETRPRCLDRPCMIMGADVTHPSPETRGTVPSVAAVTASHDAQAFQYNICWRLQPPTKEIISDLANIVKEHLMFFYKKNKGCKPERIIFFRDGVSEGQFEIVFNAEVNAIRQACITLQPNGEYQPKITFLVVQKRHHTRFFPTNTKDSDDAQRNFNVAAGTVVDTEITHPTALDFYLVSHASIQGVARPTKYRMLWDENNMTEDELEQLTYHLCHLFTRCTRSVSYPAPTYYAHLAAARAKVYCERRQINLDNLQWEQEQLTIRNEIVRDMPMFFV